MSESKPDLSRRIVLSALDAVRQGRSLPDALQQAGFDRLGPRERAFARRLAAHAVRHRRRLEADLRRFLTKPAKEDLLRNLLWLGAAQIDLPDIADHAAVNSTVELSPKRIRGLVNAVLRNRLRQGAITNLPVADDLSYPGWMHRRFVADWGEAQAVSLMEAMNVDPPLCLRVNSQHGSPDAYAAALAELGLAAERVGEDGLRLATSLNLADLPGFEDGKVSVQGAAAQQAARLMNLQPDLRVLDACSAPGGKTAHMLEIEPSLELVSVDLDPARLERVRANLQREGLKAELHAGNLLYDGPWQGEYDRVLLDAPCSGTGVIARHPDIKWLRREDDIAVLAQLQRDLLDRCWSWLRPGGQLLYCTCSILTEENEAVVSAFLAEHDDATAQAIHLPFGQASEYGWRVAPQAGLEGFYYALLSKNKK